MPCPEGDLPPSRTRNVNKINSYTVGINLARIKPERENYRIKFRGLLMQVVKRYR
jgi:hypothetical protein